MECLTAIGNGVVGKIAEYTVEPVGRQVGYVIYYSRNLEKLHNQVRDLDAARESVEHKIDEEEGKGRKVETLVTNWLTDVNKITGEAKDFLKDEHQAKIKCLYGFCPNPMARHHLSRKSTKLVLDVAELYGKKDFAKTAYDVTPEEVCVLSINDYEAYDSRTSVVKTVMDELRNSNTYMIGVYGIGGVGKTTLVKEIYKQAKKYEKLFDEVVMVLDLKLNPSIERIQKEIAEKLGLKLHEIETPARRACHICNRIKGKNTLVLLDDVWENIDLEAVGLPHMSTLKILLTSRNRRVLSSDMGTEKEFHLDVLDKKEAWNLFQKMAGDIAKKPDIHTVATQVAEKCGGLPLLIVTVARFLKNSPLHAWNDTFRRLKMLDGQGLTEKIYTAIEWSYNKLDNEELKSLFMLCGVVIGTDYSFSVVDLWKYSMGLSLLKNVETIGEAWDALNSLLEQLKDFCLLLDDTDDNTRVRMHDLVKEVAKRIASRKQHVLSLSYGSELKEWPDKDFSEKCTMICLKQCNIPKLPQVLQCQELALFQLYSIDHDSFEEIPCNFFEEMKKLRVLDLTNARIPSLPSSLQFLKNLRTLCLDLCTLEDIALIGQLQNLEILSFLRSKFKKLPKEIGQLIRLRLLDLTGCSELEVISPDVLSSLKRLEHLRIGNSFNRWEVGRGISTERSNANLEELKNLHQLTLLQIHIPDANMLPADLLTNKLERFQICIGSAWKWGDVDEALNTLKLQLTTRTELDQGLKMLLNRTDDLYLEGTEGVNNSIVYQLGPEGFQKLKHLHVQNNAEFANIINGFANIINGKVGFPNLTWLAVSELNGFRFLLSSSMARSLPQLKRLQISGCQIMEAIVSIEESDDEIAENMFCQLQDLELKDLPNLTQFCSSRSHTKMPNPSFERLQLQNSSKQEKFTFDRVNKSSTICEIEESDSKGNSDIVIQPILFDKKVEFPNLKKLFIDGLSKLTTIWNNQFSIDSSKNLESIEIVSCESLKSIFPVSVARSLQQLRELTVKNCGVEEIVSNKLDGLQMTPVFVFSKLTNLRFENLPQLRSFYPGSHASNWPSLNSLGVFGCDKLQIFAEGKRELYNQCTTNKQSLFLVEKDSFPDLEYLGLDVTEHWDSLPLHLFRKLKSLRSYAHSNSSVNSLDKLLGEIHAVGNGALPHLRVLYLYGMRKLMHLGEDNSRPTCPNFPNLEILKLKECDSLKNLRSSAISFKTLTTLKVRFCKGLKYLVTYSMAKSLMQLTKLEVEDCEEMIEIVESNETDDSGNEIEFKCLKHMKLSGLPRLRGFCSGTRMVTFPSLETLSMNCTLLETFIFDPMGKSSTIRKEIEERDSKENLQTLVPHFLFDKKVGFPSLKNLSIKGLSKLTTIWHNQLAPDSFCKLTEVEVHGCGSLLNIFVPSVGGRLNSLHTLSVKECESVQVVFELREIVVTELHDTPATHLTPFDCQNLESIEIDSCESLKHIFPASTARGLQQLRSLIVEKCGVEEIIAKEEGQQTTPKFVFSKVTFVTFDGLPKLRSFYPGMHSSSWPSLNDIGVFGCDKVQIFAEEYSSFQEQREANNICNPIKPSLFLIEKDSFPNLERLVLNGLEIWNGPLPVQLFSKLKFLDVASPMSKSVVFLDSLLPDLQGNNQSSAVGMGAQLPHLRELRLIRMYKLMHLGEEEDNSQSAPPNIPNLEILHLNGCFRLRNLRSSAIPFNNLTSLHVSCCDRLKYLITYSAAESFIHLTKLEVEGCQRLEEIVGNNEDDDDSGNYEITFRRLKHLKLWILPRLRGFCSRGNCSVKFPSLETLSISNRLKLKIFPTIGDETLQTTNEEEDTDVDECEGLLAEYDEINSASTDLIS